MTAEERWTHELRYPIGKTGEVRRILREEFGVNWHLRVKVVEGDLFVCVRCDELDALYLGTIILPERMDRADRQR
jgi:hypothetical protein